LLYKKCSVLVNYSLFLVFVVVVVRPLTEAELAERRINARLRHQEKMAALEECGIPATPDKVEKGSHLELDSFMLGSIF